MLWGSPTTWTVLEILGCDYYHVAFVRPFSFILIFEHVATHRHGQFLGASPSVDLHSMTDSRIRPPTLRCRTAVYGEAGQTYQARCGIMEGALKTSEPPRLDSASSALPKNETSPLPCERNSRMWCLPSPC